MQNDEVKDERVIPFAMIDHCFIKADEMGAYELGVYNVLVMYAGNKHKCWPSVSTIADHLKCSPRKVNSVLRLLEQQRVIQIVPRKKKGSKESDTNLYIINDSKKWMISVDEGTAPHSIGTAHDAGGTAPHSIGTAPGAEEQDTRNKIQEQDIYKGELENVNLSLQEYKKLQTRFGANTNELIDLLSFYLPNAKRKYNSHYAVIYPKNSWVVERFTKEKGYNPLKEKNGPLPEGTPDDEDIDLWGDSK